MMVNHVTKQCKDFCCFVFVLLFEEKKILRLISVIRNDTEDGEYITARGAKSRAMNTKDARGSNKGK